MDLCKRLELNPNVTMDTALKILANLSVFHLGLELDESFDQAIDRYGKLIGKLMLSDDRITKYYFTVCNEEDGRTVKFPVDQSYVNDNGPEMDISDVNILELMSCYNERLKSNGKEPIPLTMQNAEKAAVDAIKVSDICEFANGLADAVINIVSREDKLKVDTFEQIIDETTSSIKGNVCAEALPEIKRLYRDKFDSFITKGRIKAVTDKKIQAALQLMENYKDTRKIPDINKIILSIGGLKLCKNDRKQLVDTFLNYIKK